MKYLRKDTPASNDFDDCLGNFFFLTWRVDEYDSSCTYYLGNNMSSKYDDENVSHLHTLAKLGYREPARIYNCVKKPED